MINSNIYDGEHGNQEIRVKNEPMEPQHAPQMFVNNYQLSNTCLSDINNNTKYINVTTNTTDDSINQQKSLKIRRKYNPEEVKILESAFFMSHYPNKSTEHELCNRLQITSKQLMSWFNNRRQKLRKIQNQSLRCRSIHQMFSSPSPSPSSKSSTTSIVESHMQLVQPYHQQEYQDYQQPQSVLPPFSCFQSTSSMPSCHQFFNSQLVQTPSSYYSQTNWYYNNFTNSNYYNNYTNTYSNY